jgi:opacity protein-like surface antigen
MKTKLIKSMFAATLIGHAVIAGSPAPQAVMAVAPESNSWTGAFIGIQGSYGLAEISGATLNDYSTGINYNRKPIGGATVEGYSIGVTLGHDWQFSRWVVGLQAAYDYSNLTGSHQYYDGQPTNYTVYEIENVFSSSIRLGYLLNDNLLLYGRVGAAISKTNYRDDDPAFPYYGNEDATRIGIIAGIGLEYRIHRNVSVFLEYQYHNYGSHTVGITYSDGNQVDYRFKQEINRVLVGITYRF